MVVIVLHSSEVDISRALMVELGVDPHINEDIVQSPNGWKVSAKHSYATTVCPNFSAYPTIVVFDGDKTRVKSPVANLEDALDFVNNQPLATPNRILSQFEFTQLFTSAERKAIRQQSKSNTDLEDLMAVLNAAQDVNLDLPILISGLAFLVSLGILTAARRDKILTGSAP